MPAKTSRPGANGAAEISTQATNRHDDSTATLLRDSGMATALDALQPAWRSMAESVIDALIVSGAVWTADDVRDVVGAPYGTGSARALGGLIRGRYARGEIVPVGFVTSRQPQRHGGVLRAWKVVA